MSSLPPSDNNHLPTPHTDNARRLAKRQRNDSKRSYWLNASMMAEKILLKRNETDSSEFQNLLSDKIVLFQNSDGKEQTVRGKEAVTQFLKQKFQSPPYNYDDMGWMAQTNELKPIITAYLDNFIREDDPERRYEIHEVSKFCINQEKGEWSIERIESVFTTTLQDKVDTSYRILWGWRA